MLLKHPFVYASVCFLSFVPQQQTNAAAFSLNEYPGGNDMGRARAGNAAIAEDATTVFTNPAGLTRIKSQQGLFTSQLFLTSVKFENKDSTDSSGAPMRGDNGGNAGALSPVPALYYALPINERTTVGIGLNAPFGLGTKFDAGWVGRYQTIDGVLSILNLNPGIGFKINDQLSIGGGASLQYGKAELRSAIDFGAICAASLGAKNCAISPQTADGQVKFKADDWTTAFNVGLLWELDDKTRVGTTYRSSYKHTFKGDANFTVPENAKFLQANNLFTNSGVEIPLTLPEYISLSGYHALTPQLALMADVSYTRWSRYKEMRIRYGNFAQPDGVVPKNWHDTWRFALGADYTYNKQWRFQGGIAYDNSPIPHDNFDPAAPVADSRWLQLGALYRLSDSMQLNVSYAHAIINDHDINLTGGLGDTLKGTFKAGTDILNVQLQWNF